MGKRGQWLRYGFVGCLGIVAVAAVVAGILFGVAWQQVKAEAPSSVVHREEPPAVAAAGRVLIDVKSADIFVKAGEPGSSFAVEASYDERYYSLERSAEPAEDGVWTWRVWFRRTSGGGSAMEFLRMVAGASWPELHITIPPEMSLALHGNLENTLAKVDLSGLQLTELVVELAQGGLALDVAEPIPGMDRVEIDVRQGEIRLDRLGNASPLLVEVDTVMARADVDLAGAWRRDAEIDLESRFAGGGRVIVPEGVNVAGLETAVLQKGDETPLPTLYFDVESGFAGRYEIDR